MEKMRTVLAVLILVGAAACASSGNDESDEFITDFTATLEGQQGWESLGGTARAVASVGRTAITVNLEGGAAGATHPWHVHQGRCGSGGPIVGDPGKYSALSPDGEGKDREVATISVQLDDDTDYYVNVHRSPTDLGTIVACGRLVD